MTYCREKVWSVEFYPNLFVTYNDWYIFFGGGVKFAN